jgi:hypothetical protein
MESVLSTLAFALLIGAQFLAAIVLVSKRRSIYGGLEESIEVKSPPPEQQNAAAEEELPAKAA